MLPHLGVMNTVVPRLFEGVCFGADQTSSDNMAGAEGGLWVFPVVYCFGRSFNPAFKDAFLLGEGRGWYFWREDQA